MPENNKLRRQTAELLFNLARQDTAFNESISELTSQHYALVGKEIPAEVDWDWYIECRRQERRVALEMALGVIPEVITAHEADKAAGNEP